MVTVCTLGFRKNLREKESVRIKLEFDFGKRSLNEHDTDFRYVSETLSNQLYKATNLFFGIHGHIINIIFFISRLTCQWPKLGSSNLLIIAPIPRRQRIVLTYLNQNGDLALSNMYQMLID